MEWDLIRQIIQCPLPAVPAPAALGLLDSNPLTLSFRGHCYTIPRIDQLTFGAEGLNVWDFIQSFSKQNSGFAAGDWKLFREAVRKLARDGFPCARGLEAALLDKVL